MVSNQQFRLKWNNHRNTVLQEFETLLHNNSFVDCTIGADGKYLKAHKIVLSACSPYLQNVFSEHFDKHPVILLKDVSFKELKCMIDYMYCGEVNISECELPSFLRTAQSLKIKGLAEDINDYDSASDNEQQDSITENGRTVEPNVEIHDDEGPPAKKTAPSLIYSNFAGRKRKSPNNAVSSATKSSNSNEKVPPSVPLSSKLTGGNVPSCADTENSDSKVASGKENNNLHKEEPDDDKKIVTRHNHQDNVKNKPEVKEEPVDADDDNSSYEFGNNACEDSDPLNEDSESNCATPGKNFNEVSIASVSSCNEGEANDDDDMLEIKEEMHTEAAHPFAERQEEDEEHKIRVRSTIELMPSEEANSPSTLYVVSENENYNKEMMTDVNSTDEGVFHNTASRNDNGAAEDDGNTEIIEVNALPEDENCNEQVIRVLPRRSAKLAVATKYADKKRKWIESKVRDIESMSQFRKILPAPVKSTDLPSATTLVPLPMGSSLSYGGDASKSLQKSKSSSTLPTSSYRLITVSNSKTRESTADESATAPRTPVKEEVQSSAKTAVATASSSVKTEPNSQPIILLNPTTRVVLLNSDMKSSTPLYTIPRLPSAVKVTSSAGLTGRVKISTVGAHHSLRSRKILPEISAIINQKFRKIAPLVKEADNAPPNPVLCKYCFETFADDEELKKHLQLCSASIKHAKRGRKRNDSS